MSILTKIKGALRSKTIHFNVIVAAVVAVAVFVFPDMAAYLDKISVGLLAVINIYLRSITVQSLYEKGSKK